MIEARIKSDFESWRVRARELLVEKIPPKEVQWQTELDSLSLFGETPAKADNSLHGNDASIAPLAGAATGIEKSTLR